MRCPCDFPYLAIAWSQPKFRSVSRSTYTISDREPTEYKIRKL